jgi:hypothetical protein
MKKSLIKIGFWVLCLMSCTDIVKYDDHYDDGTAAYGPPVIRAVASVDNSVEMLDKVSFGQMIRLKGENLSRVKSLKFNDREADLSEIYALSHEIVALVPTSVPDEISNLITLTTEKGTTTFPIKIAFPDLVINGYSLEYGRTGDVVDVLGENFAIYDLTPEKGNVRLNNEPVTVVESTNSRLSFLVPYGVTDNAVLTLSSDRMTALLGAEPVEIPFRSSLLPLLDMGVAYSTNSFTAVFATDGSREGDPSPLVVGQWFSRFNKTPGSNSTNLVIQHNMFDIPSNLLADIKANPDGYDFKMELFVPDVLPITNTAARIRVIVGQQASDQAGKEWTPAASGSAFHTANQWQTRCWNLTYFMKPTDTQIMLQESQNLFVVAYINPGVGSPTDVSFANFRIAKNIHIIRKQL